tara:strand:+ start:272 stop:493 length:222 start_codon:yes stop_codon:yes gene_type:complete
MDLDHEKFNISMRKFLKKVGVTSQQKIEEGVRLSLEKGALPNNELRVRMTLEIEDLKLNHQINGEITLEILND